MPKFEFSGEAGITMALHFDVWCGTCNAGLCRQSVFSEESAYYRRSNKVIVDVCENCIENAERPLLERIDELEAELAAINEGR